MNNFPVIYSGNSLNQFRTKYSSSFGSTLSPELVNSLQNSAYEDVAAYQNTYPQTSKETRISTIENDFGKNLGREQVLDKLSNVFSKVMPAVSMAVFASYAGYLTQPSENLTAWFDNSSQGTWEANKAESNYHSLSNIGTALVTNKRQVVTDYHKVVVNDPIEEQPLFDFREAINYARSLGLKTDFPL